MAKSSPRILQGWHFKSCLLIYIWKDKRKGFWLLVVKGRHRENGQSRPVLLLLSLSSSLLFDPSLRKEQKGKRKGKLFWPLCWDAGCSNARSYPNLVPGVLSHSSPEAGDEWRRTPGTKLLCTRMLELPLRCLGKRDLTVRHSQANSFTI